MEFDPSTGDLRPWGWPTSHTGAFERIPVTEFDVYRVAYDFRGPLCFCSSSRRSSSGCGAREAQIILESKKRSQAGCYVAIFARGYCSYRVNLEHFYDMNGIFLKRYSTRTPSTASTLPTLRRRIPTRRSPSHAVPPPARTVPANSFDALTIRIGLV
ncbi:hypothetical protein OF83DRAFT_1178607 [Amylostereum chailletii]|nr:hypothetical protein OF83DRAFT_1178607 [Amylostereum chailletii]